MLRVADATITAAVAPRRPDAADRACCLPARDSLPRSIIDNGNLAQPALGAILFKWLPFGEGDTRGSIAFWPLIQMLLATLKLSAQHATEAAGFDIEKEGFCALH